MFGIGIQELGIVLVVALLVFGPKRLPELARTLGKGMAEFRKASSDLRRTVNLELNDPPPPRGAPPPPDPRTSEEAEVGPPPQLADAPEDSRPTRPRTEDRADEAQQPDAPGEAAKARGAVEGS